MTSSRRVRLYGALGFVVFLILWQAVGALRLAGPSIPSVSDVFAIYRQPWRLALLGRAAMSTLLSAATGLILGALLGSLTALIAHLIRPMRLGLDRLAVMINAVPAVALGPILIVTVGRDWTPSTLSSIPVFFLTFVTVSSGLRSVNPRLNDVFAALGASRVSRLVHLELPAAIPAFLAGLRVSVSAAIVGAIVGEWFGSSTGLGIIILNTMLNFQIPLMWAAMVFAVAASLIAYGLVGSLERRARSHFS